MQFTPFHSLNPEQLKTVERKWPRSDAAGNPAVEPLEEFEFTFLEDNQTPYVRRRIAIPAETPAGLTCPDCGKTGITAKGIGPHRRHCAARLAKGVSLQVVEHGSPVEEAARLIRTGSKSEQAEVETRIVPSFPGDGATISDVSARLAGSICYLPLVCLEESPTQPRTSYDSTKHEELCASLRARGWVEAFPAMVRVKPGPGFEATPVDPSDSDCARWSIVHPETRAPIPGTFSRDEAENLCATKYARRYEIVFAHRRTRAARAIGLEEAPCVVGDLSDLDVLELQLIENVQRHDLSPIDEAEHLRRLLALRDDNGQPIHTRKTLADRIGKTEDHVGKAILLCRLEGDVRAAVADARLGVAIGYELARIPDNEVRAAAAKEILNPSEGEGPMRRKAALDYIRRNCTRNLREAKFDTADPELVPARHRIDETAPDGTARYFGGSCLDCPFNSANVGERSAHAPKLGVCGNVGCFEAKIAADFDRWRAQHHKPDAGKVALTPERNAEIFDAEGEIDWRAGLVPLNSVPDAGLLSPDKVDAEGGELQTWKQLTAGKLGEVLVARDPRSGRKVEVVDVEAAKAAAELNGHKIFKTSRVEKPRTEEAHKEQTLATKRHNELARRVEERLLFEISGKATAVGFLPAGAWHWLAEWVLGTAAPAAVQKVERRRKLDSGSLADALREMDSAQAVGLVVETVLADYYAASLDDAANEGLSAFGLDLEMIAAKVREEVEPEPVAQQTEAERIVEHLDRPAEPEQADEGGDPPATFLAYLTKHAVDLGNREPVVKPYDVQEWLEALQSPSVYWVCPLGGVESLDGATYAAREALANGAGTITTAGEKYGFQFEAQIEPAKEVA